MSAYRHDGVERGRREVDLGGIRADERAGGYQAAGPFDLDIADVDPGDLVTGVGEGAGHRYPAVAAEVEDCRRDR